MSAVMFPMFLPEDFFIDKLVRAIIAISLFEAAYDAEVIRGGLQALPRGQYEAAKSLGMGYWKMHIFVILPQALKLVIPGIANTFLALVKDIPIGKQNIRQKKEIINVRDRPPHAPVSTQFKPSNFPSSMYSSKKRKYFKIT